ncbi:serine protease [Alphaproteobacteria bacterium]|nr:serine protease [Alphaproteobacteria bacterium]
MVRNTKSTGSEPKKKNIEYIVTDYSVWNKFVDGLIVRDGAYTKFRLTQLLRLRLKTLLLAILGILIGIVLLLYIYKIIVDKSNYSGKTITETIVEYVPVPDPNLSQIIEKTVIVKVPDYIPIEIPTKEGVVTDFTIFQYMKTPNLAGVTQVVTGVAYKSSKSNKASSQWCYADLVKRIGNARGQVDIARVEGTATPVRLGLTTEQARDVEISTTTFSYLYQYCQFVDAKEAIEDNPKEIPINPDKNQGVASGTAFAVNNNGYFVTNEHVVRNCSSLGIVMKGEIYPASIYSKNSELDLAIIKTNPSISESYIKFSPEIKTGQSISALGYPLVDVLGAEIKVTTGIISSMSGYKGNNNHLGFTAPIQPGNSGGPIVDQYNRLVAVATAALIGEDIQNINFAIKVGSLQRFLGANNIKYELSSSIKKIDIPTIVEKSRDYVKLILCKVK